MRQTEIHPTKEDKAALKAFRSKGQRRAREINWAHILLALDEKVPESLIMQVLGVERAERMLARVAFHYTPKHARWLNMAEIEIGVMDRQCIGGRADCPTKQYSGPKWPPGSTAVIKLRPRSNGREELLWKVEYYGVVK